MTVTTPCPIKDILQSAREEANMLGHCYIGTKHILLGTLRGGKAAEILEKQGVNLDRVRDAVRETSPTHVSLNPHRDQLPVTTRVRNIIKAADEEAVLMHSEEADSSHLLLALLRDPHSASSQILRSMNVTYDSILNDFC